MKKEITIKSTETINVCDKCGERIYYHQYKCEICGIELCGECEPLHLQDYYEEEVEYSIYYTFCNKCYTDYYFERFFGLIKSLETQKEKILSQIKETWEQVDAKIEVYQKYKEGNGLV